MNSVTARRLSAAYDGDRASWAAVRELCCRTGNNGDPIAPERWELFSRIWIEPYEKIVPEWTYVGESGAAIVGYLTGCPDSQKFQRMKLWWVTIYVLLGVAGGEGRPAPGARLLLQHDFGRRNNVERYIAPAPGTRPPRRCP